MFLGKVCLKPRELLQHIKTILSKLLGYIITEGGELTYVCSVRPLNNYLSSQSLLASKSNKPYIGLTQRYFKIVELLKQV